MTWRPQRHNDDILGRENPNERLSSTLHSRPKTHLLHVHRDNQAREKMSSCTSRADIAEMKLMTMMQRITGQKLQTDEETFRKWKAKENIEAESVAMMRHLGLGVCKDAPLNEKTTVPTKPYPKKLHVMTQGKKKIPILFGDEYFKIKQTNRPLCLSPDGASSINSSIASSDDKECISDIPYAPLRTPKPSRVFLNSEVKCRSNQDRHTSKKTKFLTPKEIYNLKRHTKT